MHTLPMYLCTIKKGKVGATTSSGGIAFFYRDLCNYLVCHHTSNINTNMFVRCRDFDIYELYRGRNSIKIINFVGDVGVMTLQNSKLWIFIERQ